jgi:hypothetical protein
MSVSSFPRPEHIPLLLGKIKERLATRGQRIEVAEAGLNQYRCEYKFALRREPQEPANILAVHFQLAGRLQKSGNDAELNRLIDEFLKKQFDPRDGNSG